jgi:hypothetical protein
MGDGVCNKLFNTPQCCFDGGDCPQSICSSCNVYSLDGIAAIANQICDEHYNTRSCCFDGGDCAVNDVQTKCSTCTHPLAEQLLDNGFCDVQMFHKVYLYINLPKPQLCVFHYSSSIIGPQSSKFGMQTLLEVFYWF